MAAGVFRIRAVATLLLPYGTYPVPTDWAQSCDEVFGPFTYDVPDGTTEEDIPVPALTTIEAVVIVADVAISVTLGVAGTNVPIPLAAKAPLILGGTALSAVSITNVSGAIAHVTVMAGGT